MKKKIEEVGAKITTHFSKQIIENQKIAEERYFKHQEIVVNKAIAECKIHGSSFRNAVHNIIEFICFLPVSDKNRSKLHYAAITIFNVAEKNPIIPVAMIGTAVLSRLGQNSLQNFSTVDSLVNVMGEALGTFYGIPLMSLGMLAGYALSAKITNGTIIDQKLEDKINKSIEKDQIIIENKTYKSIKKNLATTEKKPSEKSFTAETQLMPDVSNSKFVGQLHNQRAALVNFFRGR